jgi:hypothetical protein
MSACAYHRWKQTACKKGCEGKGNLPNKFSSTFIVSLRHHFKNKKHFSEEKKLQESIKLYAKFLEDDNCDFGRGWGYNLLSDDDPIWREPEFQRQVSKYMHHSGLFIVFVGLTCWKE